MILNDTVRQALTAGHLAHLVTLNKDGSPQVSIVWVGLDGDEIVYWKEGKKTKYIGQYHYEGQQQDIADASATSNINKIMDKKRKKKKIVVLANE
jgi:hypothetical protein